MFTFVLDLAISVKSFFLYPRLTSIVRFHYTLYIGRFDIDIIVFTFSYLFFLPS
jgi:hypothetical protein